uniref:Serpentine receptor class r-10 n=2 Tax=Caenorhabditis tropicalis TaxID=1561998 RepID=A0A1I7T1K1_9PELO
MPDTLRYLQYSGFALTEIFSLYLFVLILTRASNKFGAYKYLMAIFTLFSMVFGVIEVMTQPIMHIEGTALIVFVDSFLRYEKVIGFHMASLYCSSYGVCVLLLSTHFCYRYLAVCKPHTIRFLTGYRLMILFVPAMFFGVVWFATVEICEQPTHFVSEYLKDSLRLYYDEDSYAVAQLSAIYYFYDKTNQVVINWVACISIVILYSIMGSSITSIMIFGFKTFKSVDAHSKMSPMTKDLHRQLFHTLILQSLVPLFILFLPVGLLFLLPFFDVHPGYFANAPGAWISFYPAVDAVIAVLMIKDFRNAFLRRKRASVVAVNNFDSLTASNFRRQSSLIP